MNTQTSNNPAALLADLTNLSDDAVQTVVGSVESPAALELLYDWRFWARPTQLPPKGDWRVWLLLAGRGFGKTRTAAEFVRLMVETGEATRVCLIGRTTADVRDVMINGESGILACSHPSQRPRWEPSKRRLSWPNGAIAHAYSAEEPDLLRGPQSDLVWGDEFAAWRYTAAWDNAEMGLRLGSNPRAILTTTPRPIPRIKEMLKDKGVVVTRGSTFDNSENLARQFLSRIRSKYENTRLGRQELFAELLDASENALWTRDTLEKNRVQTRPGNLNRIVVAIDPAVGGPSETGIIVAGLVHDSHIYILEDLSRRHTPVGWARSAIEAFKRHRADRIVAECNQGGDLVASMIRTFGQNIPVKLVRATRGKYVRAEPVAALYEQGKVKHVGFFAALEDQLCTWTPEDDKSPDRLDALVWAVHDIMITRQSGRLHVW
jgi:predicted phage terminase large subunit-like protein